MKEIELRINQYGTKCYYIKGTYIHHRTDGPAIIYADGYKQYYINGKRIEFIGTNEEFIRMITEFYAKCSKCETEGEFTYLNVDNREFNCLKCGEKLNNEKIAEIIIIE